jgi:hypothetical protein
MNTVSITDSDEVPRENTTSRKENKQIGDFQRKNNNRCLLPMKMKVYRKENNHLAVVDFIFCIPSGRLFFLTLKP